MTHVATHGYVQVPPDSSGKRLTHAVMHEMAVHVVGTNIPNVGERFSTPTSGLQGYISQVDYIGSDIYDLHLTLVDPIPNNRTATIGENFLENGVVIGTVHEVGELFYTPHTVITGGTNNTHTLDIDSSGSARVTFTNGTPNFDAFGKLQVSQQHSLTNYIHQYDTLNSYFTTILEGSGQMMHLPHVSGVRLITGTDSGAKACRVTDEYHIYQPGVSQLLMFTGSLGDNGKVNVVRRGGLYDDDNGMFFEMWETTFNIVLRSKSTGTVIETRIPSTEWNRDRMDGSGGIFNPSGAVLNPTADNIFWIDYQWLGAGTIRYGVYVKGQRIVVHEFHNTNTSPHSYITSGSLPFKYEQFNIGPTISSSEFNVYSITVKTEGEFNPAKYIYTADNTVSVTTTSRTALLAVRPKEMFGGIANRSTLYPKEFYIYNDGDVPILFELVQGIDIVTNGTWLDAGSDCAAEVNKTVTSWTGGQVMFSAIVGPKQTHAIPFNALEENRQGVRRKATLTSAVELIFTARMLGSGPGGTGTWGTVAFSVNWDEVR